MQSQSIDNTPKENLFQKICRLAITRKKALIEIIDNGYTLNVRSGKYESPLQWLIQQNDLESVKFLVNNSKFKINIDFAVSAYAQAGCIEEVDALVEQGANYGNALFGYALARNGEVIGKWLAEAKINNIVFDHLKPDTSISFKNAFTFTNELLKPSNLNQIVFGYALQGDSDNIEAFLRLAQPTEPDYRRAMIQASFGFALGQPVKKAYAYLEKFKSILDLIKLLRKAVILGFALGGRTKFRRRWLTTTSNQEVLLHGYALGGHVNYCEAKP